MHGLGVNQSNQTTLEDCTPLRNEVFFPHAVEQLNLHAEGPYIVTEKGINKNFMACECPIGFQPKRKIVYVNAIQSSIGTSKAVTLKHQASPEKVIHGSAISLVLRTHAKGT